MARERFPRLSKTLPGPRHPEYCQGCGSQEWDDLECWIECDDADNLSPLVILLCRKCEERLIEKHPRLYHKAPHWEPRPGVMGICVLCRWRQGLDCICPSASFNGGSGINVTCAQPVHTHWLGRSSGGKRISGVMTNYAYPPKDCTGREELSEEPPMVSAHGQTWIDPGWSTEEME